MKILKLVSSGAVMFFGDDLRLDSAGVHGDGWQSAGFTSGDSVLEDATDAPADFRPGAYSHDAGGWHVLDSSLLPVDPPALIPQVVPKKNGKQALILTGHWTPLLDYVNALPEPDKTWALVQINDSETYRRDDDFLIQAAKALGMTDKDLDALFVLAGAQ